MLRRLFSTISRDISNPSYGTEPIRFLTLSNLCDNPGARKTKRRVGRGIGSSKGKTCGRGHKGQKSRSGSGVPRGFEGGQTRFYKTLPKRGFTNKWAEPMTPVNLGDLQDLVDMGRLDPAGKITAKTLVEVGLLKRIKHGVKLLGKGKERFATPLRMEVSRASAAAIAVVEAAGGEVETVHYNKLALRALLKPHKFALLPKRAAPPPRLMGYYTDYEKRGFLSQGMQKRKLLRRLENSDQ